MPRDPEKAKARSMRHREKLKVAKYGPAAAGVNMSGRHGNHARGEHNGRWNGGKNFTSHGYVAVRVDPSHPHAWGAHPTIKYAYEHILVVEAHLGRALTGDEVVHHRNRDRTDNGIGNLEVHTRRAHAIHHDSERGRDELGRFPPADLRVRKLPEEAGNG